MVVILGAWTRLVDAGLGCPDWPGCYGMLTVPNTAEEIAKAEALFPDAPVEVEKGWPEMIHRYFAGTLGLIILSITIVAWRESRKVDAINVPLKLSVGLLVLVICQALFGMWTVTLKLWPQVVTAHLLGGFATLSLLFLLSARTHGGLRRVAQPLENIGPLQFYAVLGLVIVLIQVFLGGWTSSNYAAYACSELPGCQGELWPPMDFGEGFNFLQSVGPNYLGGAMDNEARVAIHMTHRVGAVITLLYLGFLIWRLFGINDSAVMRRFAQALSIALLVQFALGLSNVYWHLPLAVAVAHNAGGAMLLIVLVTLNYFLSLAKTRDI